MNPNRETPFILSHKVGMVVRDCEVVDLLDRAGVVDLFDADAAAAEGRDEVVGLQLSGGNPALVKHVERVFRRHADDFAADVQVEDAPFPDEDLS